MSVDATQYYICHTMPRNNSWCDTIVKEAFQKLHNKCYKDRKTHKVLGKHLNLLPHLENLFDAEKHYTVCHRLYYLQRLITIINNRQNDNHTNIGENTDLNETPPNDVPIVDP